MKQKTPLFVLPFGIEVIGVYAARGKNPYVRLRIRPHPFFAGRVIANGMNVKRSHAHMCAMLGRALLPSEMVHHQDEDKTNDCFHNLRVISVAEHNRYHKTGSNHRQDSKQQTSETMKRMFREGTFKPGKCIGEKSPHAKLTESDVERIRTSNQSARSIAFELGVSKQVVLSVRNFKTWRHVK